MDLTINERIRKLREEKKITQSELGKALGMKCSAYSRMEREGNITVNCAFKIAEILGVDEYLILKGERKLDFSPIEPKPLVAEDPTAEKIGIRINYEDGNFRLSVMEKNLIQSFRKLELEERQKVLDFINSKK